MLNEHIRFPIADHPAGFEEKGSRTKLPDGRKVMTDKQHGATAARHVVHLANALFLKSGVTDGEDLVHDQDVWSQIGGDGKRQPHAHTRRIPLYWGVYKLRNFGELDDFFESAVNLPLLHAENRSVDVDVFASSQIRMETGPHFQQARDPAVHFGAPLGWIGDPAQDLQQRALAGTVSSNDSDHVSSIDLEGDVAQCPNHISIVRRRKPRQVLDLTEIAQRRSKQTGESRDGRLVTFSCRPDPVTLREAVSDDGDVVAQ